MNTVAEYKLLAGLPVSADERAGLTEAVLHKGDAKKKKPKKANLTEEQKDKKFKKFMMKKKSKAVGKIAKGNKKAHEMCETLDKVLSSATKHFGSKKVAKQVTEAILWKKLHDAGVKVQVTEAEMTGYFKQFDGILETVVDTQRGAKSLHQQYDPTIDGNMYKDSKTEADKAGKGEAYKKDDKWREYNKKARDKGLDDTQSAKGGEPGDRQPVAGQDASFVDGNQHPSTQNKLGEDASGAKAAVEALSKSEAGDKAKEAIKKGQGGYGNTKKEGLDLDFYRKNAGMSDEPQDEDGYVVMEGDKIECIFPNYQDAVNHVEKMKKASGKQGYTIDPRKFARGFHKKGSGDSYSTGSK
jgi:hypothetical protein